MRKALLGIALLGGMSVHAQLLQQDFQSSTTVATYVNSSAPSNGQFNSISTSGSATTVSIGTTGSNNYLRYNRTTTNAGSFARTTDFSPTPTTLMYRLDINVNGTSTTTSAAVMQVGTAFGTANSAEANASTYARFALNTITGTNTFVIRDITNGVNSPVLTGNQTVLWVMNNSGASQTYTSPLGTDATVANDKADIWAGTTLLFDDVDVQTATQTITDLKFSYAAGSGTIDFDNMLIDPIPALSATTAATAVTSTSFKANWTPVSGVTGYRIDVSQAADFSTFVSGYQNLYVSGAATSSLNITGLSQSTTYYYRVRSASQYSLGEFASGNSNVQSQATASGAPLPVKLSSFKGVQAPGGIELQWTNLTESDVARYTVERSVDGRNFAALATVNARNNGGAASYTQLDALPAQGTNYYRLQVTELSGRTSYSGIVRIVPGATGGVFEIYPNPLQGNVLGLQAGSLPKGNYTVKIVSALGQVVDNKTLNHAGGSFSQTLPVNNLKSGVYTLQLSGAGVTMQKQFVVR